MSKGAPKPDLNDLEQRIAALKAGQGSRPHMEEHYSQAQLAWRMVIEMVAGLGIGFGIGYALDTVLGTLPILMVVFTLLGLVAGIRTMIRSANEIQAKKIAADAAGIAVAPAAETESPAPAADTDERSKDGRR